MIELPKDNVMAFDPGKNTGVVEVENGAVVNAQTTMIESLMAGAPRNFIFRLKEKDYVVVEDFRLYPSNPRTDAVLYPVKAMTIIELEAQKAGQPLTYQYAGDVKSYATNNRLREAGWWGELAGDHQRDAARHALFLLVQKASDPQEDNDG